MVFFPQALNPALFAFELGQDHVGHTGDAACEPEAVGQIKSMIGLDGIKESLAPFERIDLLMGIADDNFGYPGLRKHDLGRAGVDVLGFIQSRMSKSSLGRESWYSFK